MNSENSSASKLGWIIGAVFLLLVAIGGYYYWSTQTPTAETSETAATLENESEGDSMPEMTEEEMMQHDASSAGSVQGATDSAIVMMEDGVQTVTVEGGNFFYKPTEIRVKAGTPVKVTFNNSQGFHDFVIDELDVKTTQITAGKSEVVEFTPTKKGSYEFYCSVGQHRQMGMKGTLIVE